MPAQIILNELLLDYIDRDPQTLLQINGGMFPSIDRVPEYLYKSLQTLTVGASSANNSQLALALCADRGTGEEYSGNEITIYTDRMIPSSYDYLGLQSDLFGAECAYVRIILTQPSHITDSKRILNQALRISYVLDHNARTLRGLSPGLSVSAPDIMDPTTDYNGMYGYFICRYDGINDPWSAQRLTLSLRCEYLRPFCR